MDSSFLSFPLLPLLIRAEQSQLPTPPSYRMEPQPVSWWRTARPDSWGSVPRQSSGLSSLDMESLTGDCREFAYAIAGSKGGITTGPSICNSKGDYQQIQWRKDKCLSRASEQLIKIWTKRRKGKYRLGLFHQVSLVTRKDRLDYWKPGFWRRGP